jgi:hypothetical protein
MSSGGVIERAALGRNEYLGALYDARHDTFCGIGILQNSKLEASGIVSTIDNANTQIKFITSDSYSDKFNSLEVDAHLAVSAMAGFFKMEGSAKYMNSKKQSKQSAEAALVYKTLTKVDKIDIFNLGELQKDISNEALSYSNATHIVVEICWGANALLAVKAESSETEDITQVEVRMKGGLQKLAWSINAEVGVKYSDLEKHFGSNFTFEVFGDLLLDALPINIESAIKMMRELPNVVAKCNKGRGVPLKYKLFPIADPSFKKYLGTDQLGSCIAKVSKATSAALVNVFSDINSCTLDVKEYIDEMQQLQEKLKCNFVERRFSQEMKALMDHMEVTEAELKDELAKTLYECRSGDSADSGSLKALRDLYTTGGKSIEKFRQRCSELYASLKPKLVFANSCVDVGVKYVNDLATLSSITDHEDVVLVLFADEESKTANPQRWSDKRSHFMGLVKQENSKGKKSASFVYMDCDAIRKPKEPPTTIRIVKYFGGKCISEDWEKDDAMRNVVVRAYSASGTSVNEGYIKLDGVTIWEGGWNNTKPRNRGVSLMVFDPITCNVLKNCHTFDTHGDSTASPKLIAFLDAVPDGKVVVGVTADDPTCKLTYEAQQKLASYGVSIFDIQYRSNFAFVAQKGSPAKTQFTKQCTNSPPFSSDLNVNVRGGLTAADVKIELISKTP